jgi:pyridoxamine 5'-phosphate oxidase
LNEDPFQVFESWYVDAGSEARPSRDAIALATAAADGRPSVRMVYYRGIHEGGFSFFTNYDSRKGRELAQNPFAAIVFYWSHIGRQVRIEGKVERLSPEESDRYFNERPFQSRISAIVSKQSRPIEDDTAYLEALHAAEISYKSHSVGRPDNWGGFKLLPSLFEFWTRGEHRRHHRVVYQKDRGSWTRARLYP